MVTGFKKMRKVREQRVAGWMFSCGGGRDVKRKQTHAPAPAAFLARVANKKPDGVARDETLAWNTVRRMLHHAGLHSSVPVHHSPLEPRTCKCRCRAASAATMLVRD